MGRSGKRPARVGNLWSSVRVRVLLVCVCVRARARVCVRARARVCEREREKETQFHGRAGGRNAVSIRLKHRKASKQNTASEISAAVSEWSRKA
jgi:hypothetical protein